MKCCLDVACFLLYDIDDEAELTYIMDSFVGIKIDEIQEYGHYRSLDTILQIHRWLKYAQGQITADTILESLNYPCEKIVRLHTAVSEEELLARMPWLRNSL